ncbi:hypothetical protein LVJ82_03050 [Vitreoscilla massiliensis]|uniref:PepSY domain-containing protein n=1 Tax=Vitreoscilla massiliensis TaxID=1689272 RepID=A0ABY4E2H3_9NEIS|nr:hypothetical protein [Vitreoscilla massiliensis]UOO89980.1 hypothetical protein LVJ82_03050 [Vitreoscilla massiliensis]
MHMKPQLFCTLLLSSALLVCSYSSHAAAPVCKEVASGEMESTTTCTYAGMSQAQAYDAWRAEVDGGMYVREQFPEQKITDTMPENNEEGLVQVEYENKNKVWLMELGYQGGTTRVKVSSKGADATVVTVLSAD